jgi:hypothetical protein
MDIGEFLGLVIGKFGSANVPLWVLMIFLAVIAVSSRVGWQLKGHVDDGEIRGLKAELAAKEERLRYAHDQLEDVVPRLREATETIGQLQMDLGTLRASHTPIAERDLKALAERADAAQLAIENATAGSIALGTTLGIVPGGVGMAGFPMVGFGPTPKDVIVSRTCGTQFTTYSSRERKGDDDRSSS